MTPPGRSNSPPLAGRPLPAVVFGCLRPGELRLVLFPGVGHVDGGAPCDVPIAVVPCDLRMPNTPVWVQLDDDGGVVGVWARDEGPSPERS